MSPLENDILLENEGASGESKNDEDETNSVGSFGSIGNLVDGGDDLEEEIKKRKKYKRGVIYLSFIPPGMSPTILRRYLSEYGEVERIYLQPEIKKGKKKVSKKKLRYARYTEGWVEFLKKRDAKKIANLLNNEPIGGKKKSKFREYLWNIKYLPRFKWIHLCERLSYERAVRQQRLRVEISQARKIAQHFSETVDKEEKQKKKKKQLSQSTQPSEGPSQRFVKKERRFNIEDKEKADEKREDFLKSLFG